MPPRFLLLLAATCLALLAGCGALQLDPVTNEVRPVRTVADAAKTVTVSEGMVWMDGPRRTRGLRFPPGRYPLEAEDADYWYFRAPAPLEFRTFEGGRVTSARNSAGGLMVAKGFNLLPGAGYVEAKGVAKVMVWKLGQDFLKLEGKRWAKNF